MVLLEGGERGKKRLSFGSEISLRFLLISHCSHVGEIIVMQRLRSCLQCRRQAIPERTNEALGFRDTVRRGLRGLRLLLLLLDRLLDWLLSHHIA